MVNIVRAEYTNISGTYRAWDADGNRYTVKCWSGWGPTLVYPGTRTDYGSVGEISTADLNKALGLYDDRSGVVQASAQQEIRQRGKDAQRAYRKARGL